MSSTGISVPAIPGLPAPSTIEALNIRRAVLEDLALKTLYLHGEISVRELSEHMRVTYGVANDLFQRMRKLSLCEVRGLEGTVHRIACTSQGISRALELLSTNQYAGPTPVSLGDYTRRVREQSARQVKVSPADMQRAFEHLVLSEDLLDRLGTALVSGRAIFLYGPTGTGKTSIAETLAEVIYHDCIWVPHAIEVEGQIITVFDSHIHHVVEDYVPSSDLDGRWVLCHRPRLVVGGELTIEMLDLEFNHIAKYYSAPVQLKANNGILIVDDFGRQRVRPEELLNRWVVPLDRRIDFFTLVGGRKIEVPFEMYVVFSTNVDPYKVVDDAFLRRIQTKIHVDYVNSEQFHQIFRNVCDSYRMDYDPNVVDHLIHTIRGEFHENLRACYPRDIVNQIVWAARYQGRPPNLRLDTVTQACRNYFLATPVV